MSVKEQKRLKNIKRIKLTIRYAIALLIVIWTIFPVYWMANNSFKNRVEQFSATPTFFPKSITFENYISLFVDLGFHKVLWNSFIVATVSTTIAVFIGALAAYSLSRYQFIGRHSMLVWILLTRIFPPVTFVIPLYAMMGSFDLLNTRVALILAYIAFNLPFAIWLLIGFFNEVPKEIEESAMIDGATPFQSFRKVVLPLVIPGIGATAIFTFITAWNEFLYAMIFIQSPGLTTVPVALSGLITEYLVLWGPMSAGGILSVIPIVLFVYLMQDTFIKGLTLGSVKG
ncbi:MULTISPECIES: carbohydrate ABC transporter permease [Bacillus]|uniref:carbohydrate ABC transporter permease n=1 Tax=Bacillus TaxID=1386 RepID=UPI000BB955C0|nr:MULTISPECIES: carbohydrate ABC transporter permease [Bacillus]